MKLFRQIRTWVGWIGVVLWTAGGCWTGMAKPALRLFKYTEPHMGTLFHVSFYAPEQAAADRAEQAVYQRIEDLNRIMSDYLPDSELSRISSHPVGKPIPLSRDLFKVLKRALQIAKATDGAFDVTVGPSVRLWRTARKEKRLPTAAELKAADQRTGYRKLRLDSKARTLTLLAPGLELDLGGIAKGYAADQALAVLRRFGITRALVAASGDIAIGDAPLGRKAWRVAIGSPDPTDPAPVRVVPLKNAGISTSGDTQQFVVIHGVRYSHIVDPRTGIGLTNRVQVTVIARHATTTDSLATGLSVLGPKEGLKVADRMPGIAALFLQDQQGKWVELPSKRFKGLFSK